MESTAARQAREKKADPITSAIERTAERRSSASAAKANAAATPHAIGYGLPCATCRAYYPADLPGCPICHSPNRVSLADVTKLAASVSAQPSAESKMLVEERERLRELKSQIYASTSPATTFRCALDQNHDGTVEPAAVCHSCYGNVKQRVERLEESLRIDPKEAAEIVYQAVWADSSDPGKTYMNAATALLKELHKRAGLQQ